MVFLTPLPLSIINFILTKEQNFNEELLYKYLIVRFNPSGSYYIINHENPIVNSIRKTFSYYPKGRPFLKFLNYEI